MNGQTEERSWSWLYTMLIGFAIDLLGFETLFGFLANNGFADMLSTRGTYFDQEIYLKFYN